ncbi:hypothetical protein HOLleu_02736 [Holothuria leucospilota]|uniref:Uncharacterized protein n=1 Tax=Holothuria leucospilota TaxID=206669 RepID=A0A9Q1CRQ1_HOLLE|nr:hypothetical protein HOLleu_02736 [Holothuria leucospilota]
MLRLLAYQFREQGMEETSNMVLRRSSLVIIRSWNQFLRYSTLQVYHCAIVNMHALPALGPDQNTIK